MIAREVGVDPSKINYVAFRGGGEATAAILGGNVTVGGSGYSEFAEYIQTGKMCGRQTRALEHQIKRTLPQQGFIERGCRA